jgi:hypothetical protein
MDILRRAHLDTTAMKTNPTRGRAIIAVGMPLPRNASKFAASLAGTMQTEFPSS